MFGAPDCALDDEIVTMRPEPQASMSGTAAWTQLNVPVRLTATMRSHFSDVMSRSGVNDSMPALVTRSSTGPSSARTCANADATASRSATSTATASALLPAASTSAAAASAASPVLVEDRDVVAVGRELPRDAEPDARGSAGDDGDATHRARSTGVNSRCSRSRPRSTHVGV